MNQEEFLTFFYEAQVSHKSIYHTGHDSVAATYTNELCGDDIGEGGHCTKWEADRDFLEEIWNENYGEDDEINYD